MFRNERKTKILTICLFPLLCLIVTLRFITGYMKPLYRIKFNDLIKEYN